MSDGRKSIVLYFDSYEAIRDMSLEDKGILLDCIFNYSITGIVNDCPPAVRIAFNFIKNRIDADNEKYERICRKNREAINIRWNKENTGEYERKRRHTKDTDTESDTDTDFKKEDNKLSSKRKSPIPGGWQPKESTVKKLLEYGYQPSEIPQIIEEFIMQCQSKGYKYANFDATLLVWKRKGAKNEENRQGNIVIDGKTGQVTRRNDIQSSGYTADKRTTYFDNVKAAVTRNIEKTYLQGGGGKE